MIESQLNAIKEDSEEIVRQCVGLRVQNSQDAREVILLVHKTNQNIAALVDVLRSEREG